MAAIHQQVKETYHKLFGSDTDSILSVSPGRVNIIGEHIDYNDGYVLPAAMDKMICFAFEKNNSNQSRIIAIDLNDEFEINLTDPIELTDNMWTNYLRGVLKQLKLNVEDNDIEKLHNNQFSITLFLELSS